MSGRYFHVANGHCTTRLIERSSVPGRTEIWADPLNEGPVPGSVTDDELLRIRAEFLASSTSGAEDVAIDLRRWRAAIDDEDYDELVLWFEHDLFDQLNLIQLLSHLGSRTRSKPATLICIDRHPGHPHFKGLGELEPTDLEALFTTRRPVTSRQIELASRAWVAYRSPDPRAIVALVAGDTSALPFLAPALARHLEEFPSESDGLSRSERRMMEQAVDGPADIRSAFLRMHQGETAYYIADSWFYDRATDLSNASPALMSVTIASDKPDAPGSIGLPSGTIALTPEGRNVLDGHADRIRLSGIDRWLGGVHIHGHGRAWRWSAHTGQLRFA